MSCEWIKVKMSDDVPPSPFLISDSFGAVNVGTTAFDYYDAAFWFPMPEWPFSDQIITNDLCVNKLLSNVALIK